MEKLAAVMAQLASSQQQFQQQFVNSQQQFQQLQQEMQHRIKHNKGSYNNN